MKKPIGIEDLQETLLVSDVAYICGVRPESVARWIRKGKLVAIRPPTGRPLKIRREDFLEFLKGYTFTS